MNYGEYTADRVQTAATGFLPTVEAPNNMEPYATHAATYVAHEATYHARAGMDFGSLQENQMVVDENGNPVPTPKTEVPACLEKHWERFGMDSPPGFTRWERIRTGLPCLGLLVSVILAAVAMALFTEPESLVWLTRYTEPWTSPPFESMIAYNRGRCPESHPVHLAPGGIGTTLPDTVPAENMATIVETFMSSGGYAPSFDIFRLTHVYSRRICGKRADPAVYPPYADRELSDSEGNCPEGSIRCFTSCFHNATSCPVSSVRIVDSAAGAEGAWEFDGRYYALETDVDSSSPAVTEMLVAAGVPPAPNDETSIPRLCAGAGANEVMHIDCGVIQRTRFGYDDTWRGTGRYHNKNRKEMGDLDALCHDNTMSSNKHIVRQDKDQRVAFYHRAEPDAKPGVACKFTRRELVTRPQELMEDVKSVITAAGVTVEVSFLLFLVATSFLFRARMNGLPARIKKHKLLIPMRVLGVIACVLATGVIFFAVAVLLVIKGQFAELKDDGCFEGDAATWAGYLATDVLKPMGILIAAAVVPLGVVVYYGVALCVCRKQVTEF